MTRLIILAVLPLLGACVTSTQNTGSGAGANTAAAKPRPVTRPMGPPPTRPAPVIANGEFKAPRVMNLPGVEGVIGASPAQLQRLFGAARLDVFEGDARKLQFAGEPCVLDVYLYPVRQGADPTATYVDARRSSDGLDVDRSSCIAALRR
jgi:hypothetical protein